MPGHESLVQHQYYAHPRNAFWPIVCQLLEGKLKCSYTERCRLLTAHQISLWDVLASCRRPGSLDSAILRASETPNRIDDFCRRHPELEAIACNGRTAEILLRRHFIRPYPQIFSDLTIIPLPSTSPAMARLRPTDKLALWQEKLAPFLPQPDGNTTKPPTGAVAI